MQSMRLIDGVGISSVVEQEARAASAGARLELVTNARVDRILALTGLAGRLSVYAPSGRPADAQPSAAGSSREAEPAGVRPRSRALRPASARD